MLEKISASDLSYRGPGERLVVWGIRTLVSERRAGMFEPQALNPVFSQFGVLPAVASLERFLDVLAQAAHAPLLLHNVGCRCLSPGESDLLGVIASAQHEDQVALRTSLGQWLPRHALDWAEMPLLGLARTFAGAGLFMPVRPRASQAVLQRRWGATDRPTLH